MWIACRENGEYLRATVDQVEIFKNAISQQQMLFDYNSGNGREYMDLFGSYAVLANANNSLDDSITYALDVPVNITGKNTIQFEAFCTRTGSNFKVGMGKDNTSAIEQIIDISGAKIWQTITVDISSLSDSQKSGINKIRITVMNADEDTVFAIKNVSALSSSAA
jgi:hypothetical protein